MSVAEHPLPAPRTSAEDEPLVDPINWNAIKDDLDLVVWNKLITQFWVDDRMPLANDLASWATMTEEEKTLTKRVFTGLTLLDTVQGMVGAEALKADAVTPHEAAVYTNIAFMENIHAKSYSKVFSTLCSSREIDAIFRWGRENPHLQNKQRIVLSFYKGADPRKKKVASTLLESFLFYSGFYLPLYWASQGKLTNTADMISLIIRDEAVHGYYIGYKYQRSLEGLDEATREDLKDWTYSLLLDLYENECAYTESLYDGLGLTAEVKTFLRYNANKALMNLGYEPLFDPDDCEVDPKILAALTLGSATGDFFSTTNTYVLANRVETTDGDWARFTKPVAL